MDVHLTFWPDCAAPHSPLPASGCRPPCPPPLASASSPPPGAFGCSSAGRQHNIPALMSHCGGKHTNTWPPHPNNQTPPSELYSVYFSKSTLTLKTSTFRHCLTLAKQVENLLFFNILWQSNGNFINDLNLKCWPKLFSGLKIVKLLHKDS